MHRLDLRLEIMDRYDVQMQVLSTPSPPLDELFEPGEAQSLARLANEGMAEIVAARPDRFLGIATISLLDIPAAIRETERAIRDLGLRGVLLYTSQRGEPLDRPELHEYYALIEELDVPVWLHPERSVLSPDYRSEDASRFGMFLVFGWPYETTIAMARLVLSGVLERFPALKIIAHHAGAMVPRLANRIQTHYNHLPRIDAPDLSLPAIDYFKRFYVDTVTQGSVPALMAAYQVFGADRMLFASDMPFGGDDGANFLRMESEALDVLPIPDSEKRAIWGENLLKICGLTNIPKIGRRPADAS